MRKPLTRQRIQDSKDRENAQNNRYDHSILFPDVISLPGVQFVCWAKEHGPLVHNSFSDFAWVYDLRHNHPPQRALNYIVANSHKNVDQSSISITEFSFLVTMGGQAMAPLLFPSRSADI